MSISIQIAPVGDVRFPNQGPLIFNTKPTFSTNQSNSKALEHRQRSQDLALWPRPASAAPPRSEATSSAWRFSCNQCDRRVWLKIKQLGSRRCSSFSQYTQVQCWHMFWSHSQVGNEGMNPGFGPLEGNHHGWFIGNIPSLRSTSEFSHAEKFKRKLRTGGLVS